MNNKQIHDFVTRWMGRGDEKQDTQSFWIELFGALGVANPSHHLSFERRVKTRWGIRYIDVYIPNTRVIVEQKSLGIDLSHEATQSGGEVMTPYEQARRYNNNLPHSDNAKWIVCCNFESFEIHNMDRPLEAPEVVMLDDLDKEYTKLEFLVDRNLDAVRKEEEISIQAGKLVGELYDAILPQYAERTDYALKSLNQLCVRLVFCLYAEDSGLFAAKDAFCRYLSQNKAGHFRRALIDLFKVLDTPYEQRDRYLDPDLGSFPYIKGGIFSQEIEIPLFTDDIITLLIDKAALGVDWSGISPTVFGAVFESTLNPETRHAGGMHYTSPVNIHKVIDNLFLNDLEEQLSQALSLESRAKREQALLALQNHIASLTFLDPACGSGNFLTETYISLRRLENRILEALGVSGMINFGEEFSPIKVKIDQFYGIEINDFAVLVARIALWIAESQMMIETEHIVGRHLDFFPLRENHNIIEANALRVEWRDVVAPEKLNYIMGNPPFLGARVMAAQQKADVLEIFGKKWKNVGNLDYVCCWYKKAFDYTKDTTIRCAFVSANSICQGEQVANLWKPLMEAGLKINFAYNTFKWDSDSDGKAHVHCIIVGFSFVDAKKKVIYDGDNAKTASNINAYLKDAPSVFVESRNKGVCLNIPPLLTGSQRIDNDNYVFSREEKNKFIEKEPKSAPLFRRWYGAEEFINNKERWCLYLGQCSPKELRLMPQVLLLVDNVKQYRLSSSRKQTIKAADCPTKFGLEVIPTTNYLIIPVVSSERRKYIPIGFMTPDVLCSNQVNLVPDASIYHFGVLTSSLHMAWMRMVAGRLKSDYRYSKDIVYNNFVWPTPSEAQKDKIASTAQAILDARALYPDSSLADLYDELTMPIELRRAHQGNDRAVLEAYGLAPNTTEEIMVEHMFKLYQQECELQSR